MISVCMATYNGEDFIKEQLNSILIQLSLDDEIIISDDGSTDNTLNLINSFSDQRIKLLKNPYGSGVQNNFSNALKATNGEIIFLCDQDDIWDPDKVSIMIEYLKKYDLVCSDAIMINEAGESLNKSFFEIISPKKTFFGNVMRNSFLGCCMAFNKNVLEVALPFPKNNKTLGLTNGHDWWLGLVGLLFFKTKHIPEKLTFYRRHGKNDSTTSEKSKNSFYVKILLRINIIKQIVRLFFQKNRIVDQ